MPGASDAADVIRRAARSSAEEGVRGLACGYFAEVDTSGTCFVCTFTRCIVAASSCASTAWSWTVVCVKR